MTSEEYDKLTDEEKRIKVAECCGIVDLSKPMDSGVLDMMMPAIPDYLNDLNACHEFEMAQGSLRFNTLYLETLQMVCNQPYPINATAAQRCKAFVLTMDTACEHRWDVAASGKEYCIYCDKENTDDK